MRIKAYSRFSAALPSRAFRDEMPEDANLRNAMEAGRFLSLSDDGRTGRLPLEGMAGLWRGRSRKKGRIRRGLRGVGDVFWNLTEFRARRKEGKVMGTGKNGAVFASALFVGEPERGCMIRSLAWRFCTNRFDMRPIGLADVRGARTSARLLFPSELPSR